MTWEMQERSLGSVTVVELSGRLTRGKASDRLEKRLRGLIVGGAQALLLECSGVDGIDSEGIRILARSVVTAEKHGGKLKLLTLSPRMRAALDIVGLLKAIEAFDDEATALASFAGSH